MGQDNKTTTNMNVDTYLSVLETENNNSSYCSLLGESDTELAPGEQKKQWFQNSHNT